VSQFHNKLDTHKPSNRKSLGDAFLENINKQKQESSENNALEARPRVKSLGDAFLENVQKQ